MQKNIHKTIAIKFSSLEKKVRNLLCCSVCQNIKWEQWVVTKILLGKVLIRFTFKIGKLKETVSLNLVQESTKNSTVKLKYWDKLLKVGS